MKHVYLTALIGLCIIINKPIFSQDFPSNFPWIADTVYISGSGENGGNGSLNSPYNNWNDFSFNSKTAYLFKRGTVMDVPGKLVINSDSIFFGGYGNGERPKFYGKGTNKHFYFCGTQQYIQGINIQCQDTGTCITFSGDSSMFLWADSMELSHAWWGTNPGGYGKIILSNLYVHRTRVDGIYSAHNDTIIIRNTRVHDVNRWYEHIQDINTSGGDCIQGESNGFAVIDGCTLDHSDMPGKFALIQNGADTVVVTNSTLIGYDYSTTVYIGGTTQGWHFDGCKIIGGKYGLWNHGNLVVKNCVFKNQWKNSILGPQGIICNSVFANNTGREYYDAQGNLVTTKGIVLPVSGDDTRLKIYNNIFYNVNQSIQCFKEYINKTIMMYNNNFYNDTTLFEEQPKSQLGENVFNVDPKFDTSRGDTNDYYLSEDSPLIDAGLDLSTVGILLTTDINGYARPNGKGYDIGAYEFYAPTGIKPVESNIKDPSVKIYPNPTAGEIYFKSKSEPIQSIAIFSIDGRKLQEINILNTDEYYLDLANFSSHIFIAKIQLLNSSYSTIVLKKQ